MSSGCLAVIRTLDCSLGQKELESRNPSLVRSYQGKIRCYLGKLQTSRIDDALFA